MLNILLMIILIIIFFIIVLLYIGVKIALIYDKTGSKLEGCLKILILKKIKVYSLEFPSKDEEEEIEEEDEEDESEGKSMKEIFKLAEPCFEDFKIFLESFNKCIKVKKLENHLIFGLNSYVDTAKYIGYIWGLLAVLNNGHEKSRLSAEPSFNGAIFDIAGENEIDINILKLIPPTLRLIFQKEVRELIRGVRNG